MPYISEQDAIRTITHVEVFNRDVVVHRAIKRQLAERGQRGEITEFTDKARARLAFIAANTSVTFVTMITLTYPKSYPSCGRVVKGHFTNMMKRIDRRHEGSYLWFLEFQKRGAPHYHYLTTIDHKLIDKMWLSQSWYEIVGSGDPAHLLAGTRVEKLRKAGGAYAVKYAYKMRQKEVPGEYVDVGRFYGYSRDVKPKSIMTIEGNLDVMFDGHKDYKRLLESGYRVIFNAAARVASNVINNES